MINNKIEATTYIFNFDDKSLISFLRRHAERLSNTDDDWEMFLVSMAEEELFHRLSGLRHRIQCPTTKVVGLHKQSD